MVKESSWKREMQRKEWSQIEAPATLRGQQSAHTDILASPLPSQTLFDCAFTLWCAPRTQSPGPLSQGPPAFTWWRRISPFEIPFFKIFCVVLHCTSLLLKMNPSSSILRKIRDSDLGRECVASTEKPDHGAAGLWFLLSSSSPHCISYTGKEKSVSSRAS